ncbi:hypothetical protein SK128_024130 [Halocaridina rubra]|uniref:Uncharacterized protein n=1 Tax=Halocaridina rubra TaxID=373956 RepID=A0AAN9ABQ7_HALRR
MDIRTKLLAVKDILFKDKMLFNLSNVIMMVTDLSDGNVDLLNNRLLYIVSFMVSFGENVEAGFIINRMKEVMVKVNNGSINVLKSTSITNSSLSLAMIFLGRFRRLNYFVQSLVFGKGEVKEFSEDVIKMCKSLLDNDINIKNGTVKFIERANRLGEYLDIHDMEGVEESVSVNIDQVPDDSSFNSMNDFENQFKLQYVNNNTFVNIQYAGLPESAIESGQKTITGPTAPPLCIDPNKEALVNEKKSLSNDLATCRATVNKLEQQLKTTTVENKNLQKLLNECTEDNTRFKRGMEENLRLRGALEEKHMLRLKQVKEDCQKAINEYIAKLESSSYIIEQKGQMIDSLKLQIKYNNSSDVDNDPEGSARSILAAYNQLREEFQKHQDKYITVQGELDQVSSIYRDLESSHATLKTDHDLQKSTLAEKIQMITEQNATNMALQNRLRACEDNLEASIAQMAALRDKYDELIQQYESEKQKQQGEHTTLTSKCSVMETSLSVLETRLKSEKENVNRLMRQVEECQALNAQLVNKEELANIEITKLKKERQDLIEESKILKRSGEGLQVELDQERKEKEELTHTLKSVREKNAIDMDELNKDKVYINDMDTILEMRSKENSQLKNELHGIKNNYDALKASSEIEKDRLMKNMENSHDIHLAERNTKDEMIETLKLALSETESTIVHLRKRLQDVKGDDDDDDDEEECEPFTELDYTKYNKEYYKLQPLDSPSSYDDIKTSSSTTTTTPDATENLNLDLTTSSSTATENLPERSVRPKTSSSSSPFTQNEEVSSSSDIPAAAVTPNLVDGEKYSKDDLVVGRRLFKKPIRAVSAVSNILLNKRKKDKMLRENILQENSVDSPEQVLQLLNRAVDNRAVDKNASVVRNEDLSLLNDDDNDNDNDDYLEDADRVDIVGKKRSRSLSPPSQSSSHSRTDVSSRLIISS